MDITFRIIREIVQKLSEALPGMAEEEIKDAVMETVLLSLDKCDRGEFVSANHICKWIYISAYRSLLKRKAREITITEIDKLPGRRKGEFIKLTPKQLEYETGISRQPGSGLESIPARSQQADFNRIKISFTNGSYMKLIGKN